MRWISGVHQSETGPSALNRLEPRTVTTYNQYQNVEKPRNFLLRFTADSKRKVTLCTVAEIVLSAAYRSFA